MVRATAAQMLVLFGGTYPPGHDATTFGNIATHTDAWINAYCLPSTLSTTDASALGVANMIAVHFVNHALYLSAGGVLSGESDPHLIPHDITDLLDKLLMDTTNDGFVSLDMIDEDA